MLDDTLKLVVLLLEVPTKTGGITVRAPH
jgi:hypothetical protein